MPDDFESVPIGLFQFAVFHIPLAVPPNDR